MLPSGSSDNRSNTTDALSCVPPSFPSSRGTHWHRATRVWDRQVPGAEWERILLAETLVCSPAQRRAQRHVPVLAHPAAPAALPAAAWAGCCWASLAVASRSAAALTAVSRHGCAVPLRPCHTHGWSARGASRQSCPSQEQGLSSRGEGALATPESPAQAGGTGRPVLALGACSTAAQTPPQEHSPA